MRKTKLTCLTGQGKQKVEHELEVQLPETLADVEQLLKIGYLSMKDIQTGLRLRKLVDYKNEHDRLHT